MQIKFFAVLHTTLYDFTCERYRIGQDLKDNAILMSQYTACDNECMRFSSYTPNIRWLATMMVDRK
jgi:hypothetical protein